MAAALRKILENPNADRLSLKQMDLVDVKPLCDRLSTLANLRSLDLSGNRLANLPANMSKLRSLQTLDVTQNMFPSLSSVLPVLQTLPSLNELLISASDEEEEQLLMALPRLVSLNGVDLAGEQMPPPPPQQQQQQQPQPQPPPQQASSSDGAGAPGIFKGGQEASGMTPREVTLTKQDLEALAVLFKAIKTLRGPISPEQDRRMTASFETHLQMVVNRLNERLEHLSDNSQRQSETILAKHGLYDVCFQEVIGYANSMNGQLGNVLRRICNVHSELFQSIEEVLNSTASENVQLHKELRQSEAETRQLLEAAETLEKEAESHQTELLSLRKEVRRLQVENDNMAQSSSWGRGDGRGSGSQRRHRASPQKQSPSVPAFLSQTVSVEDASSYTIRNLTLKQLKDQIDLIYASKEKFDAKCVEAQLPKETMEQHMYSYLNQRYGLRKIIIENATSLIKAMHKYMDQDNDVAVFSKVFRNEIDEEFRKVQSQIKETVSDLLRIHLKGKHRLKSDEVISDQLREKISGILLEDEWSNIIKYMYNPEDSATLVRQIKDSEHVGTEGEDQAGIEYQTFLKILLDFQLRGHERFLMRFRELFQSVDTDRDGVVDEDQFTTLVSRVSPSRDEDEIQELLEAVDPGGTKRITFSDSVTCLSPDIVDMMITVARAVSSATEWEP